MNKNIYLNEKSPIILLGLVRVFLGFIFLWAFLDKLFGLGFATVKEKAWISGGSPTLGYLGNLDGTLSYFFNQLAGLFAVDLFFMAGLFVIGVSLIFGVFNKIGNLTGIFLISLIYLSALPIKNNPFVDEHIIYIFVLALLASKSRVVSF